MDMDGCILGLIPRDKAEGCHREVQILVQHVFQANRLLVRPFVVDDYAQGAYELAAPTWGQLILDEKTMELA
jgi:hypothetical protein